MGRQWSAGKLVLILGTVHWNPEAPPRALIVSLPVVRSRKEGRSQLILPKNRKQSAIPGWGDGNINSSEVRNCSSQRFSTPNEMRQPQDALLLTHKVPRWILT
ncbi:hypothetical protein Vadar_022970 [Vaccinium darrowii]|uniref:Uncharacterized protein n=1 Tax=Vaccinium darrowii TaxID=229202 RepID=A0ACB7XR90_9ERIC|nr:hypothetical protein Vadar_017288 [Vaccinium darrowii]KAH7845145.1 hypothetical protein Vadar_022970 [Vaccinium darrowii]